MIYITVYILVIILLALFLFNLTSGIFKFIIIALFAGVFGIIFFNSNSYLDLPISASIIFTYFLFVAVLGIIPAKFVNYIIIVLITAAFILYLINHANIAQEVMNFAFYSIIIFIIRLITEPKTDESH